MNYQCQKCREMLAVIDEPRLTPDQYEQARAEQAALNSREMKRNEQERQPELGLGQ
jgi:hypothetical protein